MFKHVPVAPDSSLLERGTKLEGTYLFAGHHFEIFGHDLIEFGTRLWPLLSGDLRVDGIVVLPWKAGNPEAAGTTTPSREVLAALGFEGEVVVVTDAPVQVERLLVPDPVYFVNDHCLDICREVFEAVGAAHAADNPPAEPHRKVFLSRRQLGGRQRSTHEELLERVASSQGYEVVHPEKIPFADQVRMMQESVAVAGIDGSAMHLAVFCRPGTRVICFDTRYVRNQYVLESLMGLSGSHVELSALDGHETAEIGNAVRRALGEQSQRSTTSMPSKKQPSYLDSSKRINAFAERLDLKRYLEIGVSQGRTFLNVNIPERDGVDPKFLFDYTDLQTPDVRFQEMTSDQFFTEQAHGTYDLIFIDGLHTFQQTFRDFCASLSFAHPKTLWIIDDTMPTDIFSAHPDVNTAIGTRRLHGKDTHDWHGDVYRIVPAIHDFFPQFSYVTATSGRNPQTLLWMEPRAGFAPRFNQLEKIERLDYFEFLELRDLFNTEDDDDAVIERVLAGIAQAGNRPPAPSTADAGDRGRRKLFGR
jgi:hypothetical protein